MQEVHYRYTQCLAMVSILHIMNSISANELTTTLVERVGNKFGQGLITR